jgi:hypothetical protein
MTLKPTNILIGVLALAILSGVAVTLSLPATHALCSGLPCARGRGPLPVGVDANGLLVKITNGDIQDWRNVRVRVNDRYACPAVDRLNEDQSITMKLIECNAEDGERFQPVRTAVVKIAVTAVQVNDGGEATNTFR